MRQLRTMIATDEAITAGTTTPYDLPVNPLSFISFTLKGLNVTDEATLAQVLARGTKISVTRLGQTQLDVSLADLWALNCVLFGRFPMLGNRVATDNATRNITLILPFGRRLYDPNECYPKTINGEFKLAITISSTETELDGIIFLIEAVELLDASPKQYLKMYTLSPPAPSVGELGVELNRGNRLLKLLLWGTTVITGTAWTNTIEWVKLLKDNVESDIAKQYWESLHGEMIARVGIGDYIATAAGADALANYGLMEFDPFSDDRFLVETKGLSSLKLQLYAGDTNVFRVIPIELVSV